MASPGDLVRVISEKLGVPEPTVTQHDRNLVVAGLRSKGGRGRSAAKVTPRDAAHLLTAIMGSGLVKDSVIAVERYAATRINTGASISNNWSGFMVPELAALPGEHSFLDAFEALITSSASGSLIEGLYQAATEIDGQKIPYILPPIHVSIQTPNPIADIRIAGMQNNTARTIRYCLPYPTDKDFQESQKLWSDLLKKYEVITESDLMQFREITSRTILKIGEVLSK